MFTVMAKGAPANAKAAAIYNDLIRFWGLSKKHSYIVQGDKIKYIYLKQKPIQNRCIRIPRFLIYQTK
jgi:hypothetical protein